MEEREREKERERERGREEESAGEKRRFSEPLGETSPGLTLSDDRGAKRLNRPGIKTRNKTHAHVEGRRVLGLWIPARLRSGRRCATVPLKGEFFWSGEGSERSRYFSQDYFPFSCPVSSVFAATLKAYFLSFCNVRSHISTQHMTRDLNPEHF